MTTTPAPFAGFGPDALRFLAGLEADNSKPYFDAHRTVFERDVKAPMAALLAEAAQGTSGTVKLFRINRDVRFSRDKSPYKTNFYGVVQAIPRSDAGLYASLSTEGLYAATGYYDMAGDQLERYRAAVAGEAAGPAFASIVSALVPSGLELRGRGVETAPRGISRDHPRIALLRLKEVVAGRLLPAGPALFRRDALDHALATWRAAAALVAWLDAHVGPSRLTPEARYGRSA